MKPLAHVMLLLFATIPVTIFPFIATSESPITSDPAAPTVPFKRFTQNLQSTDISNEQTSKSMQNRAHRPQTLKQERSRNKTQSRVGKLARETSDNGKSPRQRLSQASQDPTAMAQREIRLMAGYHNTPPLFVTRTRDFFVDVMHHKLGANLTTITALDTDGDPLEYSIQPANLKDASPYFSIDSESGQLRLAKKSLPFYSNPLPRSKQLEDTKHTQEASTEEDENEDYHEKEAQPEAESIDEDATSKNLYFLNVAADDGKYKTIVELQIHVINTSAMALGGVNGLPVQLTPDGGRVASDTIESIIRRRTHEFYDRIHNLPLSHKANSSSATIVYPNFINPSLVRPDSLAEDSDLFTPIETISTAPTTTNSPPVMLKTLEQPEQFILAPPIEHQKQLTLNPRGPAELSRNGQIHETWMTQPMLVSFAIIGSCMMITFVVFLYVVSVKIKKRLKRVEQQHEHLSQQASNGSCILSSSSLSQSQVPSSLSQFTLGSDQFCTLRGSSICRQSSLDSSTTGMNPCLPFSLHLNRVNNESITNPTFLQQQQYIHQHHQQQHAALLDHDTRFIQHHAYLLQNDTHIRQETNCDNIYCPMEDDYSIINTDGANQLSDPKESLNSSSLEAGRRPEDANSYLMTYCTQPEPVERPSDSPISDSGSSTRSLARFLSLPARHSVQQQQIEQPNHDQDTSSSQLCNKPRQFDSKTIARTSQVDREQINSNHEWELDRCKLKFLKILDEGQFGLVWRCALKQDNKERIVAAKTLKNSTSKDRGHEELLAEIDIMKLVCRHPNVVKILHCCTSNISDRKPILLVMEYVELGKLQSFLEKSRENHHYTTNLFNNNLATKDHLTSRDLIKFIYHVAKGMEYISSQCIVHRDLASRNILVSAQRICKIGDFGMARHMQSHSGVYERHSRNTKVPVRWMAPEVLLNNSFTTKSDVFSFGILMWEIVTLGSTPYRHLKTDQVIEAVARNGERPGKPDYCHSQLYMIMSKCWLQEPDERPTFRSLVKQLDELLLSSNDYIELDQYPDHNYYNIPKTSAPFELL